MAGFGIYMSGSKAISVTLEISGENINISKVIPLSRGLMFTVNKIIAKTSNDHAKQLGKAIVDDKSARFLNIEKNNVFSKPTFLDPRFKKNGFFVTESYEHVKQIII
jgi:hypothetical protein